MSLTEVQTFRAHPKTPKVDLTNHDTVENLQNCEDTLIVYMDVMKNRQKALSAHELKSVVLRRRLESYAFQLRMIAPIQIAVNVLKMHKPDSEILHRYNHFEKTSH